MWNKKNRNIYESELKQLKKVNEIKDEIINEFKKEYNNFKNEISHTFNKNIENLRNNIEECKKLISKTEKVCNENNYNLIKLDTDNTLKKIDDISIEYNKFELFKDDIYKNI